MTTTSKSDAPVTLINVFTVSHHLQQRLVDMLVEAKDQVMKGLPGFVSANIPTRALTGSGWSTMPSGAAPRTSKP